MPPLRSSMTGVWAFDQLDPGYLGGSSMRESTCEAAPPSARDCFVLRDVAREGSVIEIAGGKGKKGR